MHPSFLLATSSGAEDKENFGHVQGNDVAAAAPPLLEAAAAGGRELSLSSSRVSWPSVWSSIDGEKDESMEGHDGEGGAGGAGGAGGGGKSALWWAAEVMRCHDMHIER